MDKLEIGTNNPLVLKQCSILASTQESVNGVVIVWNPAQATLLEETMATPLDETNSATPSDETKIKSTQT